MSLADVVHNTFGKYVLCQLGIHCFVSRDDIPDNTLDVILNTTPGYVWFVLVDASLLCEPG